MVATSPGQGEGNASAGGDAVAPAVPTKRRLRRGLLIGLAGVVIVGAVVAWVQPRIQLRILVERLNDEDPKVRLRACRELGSMRMPAAVAHLGCVVTEEPDRQIVDWAGFGLAKAKDRQGLPPLREAVERGPDDVVLAKLFRYLAQLGGDGEADFLRKHAGSESAWRAIGAAAGSLEANDITGGAVLLRYMEQGSAEQKLFAAQALLEYAVPMMDMIGQRLDIDVSPDKPLPDDQVAAIKAWWLKQATARLLNDYIVWHQRPNPKWRRVVRLTRASEKAAQWLGINEDDPKGDRP